MTRADGTPYAWVFRQFLIWPMTREANGIAPSLTRTLRIGKNPEIVPQGSGATAGLFVLAV
jgi:hypothetical protein